MQASIYWYFENFGQNPMFYQRIKHRKNVFYCFEHITPISESKWWSLSHVSHYDKTLGTFENTLTRNVFYISLLFSNVRRVLSQCNTQLRLFSLLNILIITDLLIKKLSQSTSGTQLGALHQQHIYSNFLIHHSKFCHVNKILWLFNFSICRCWLEWQVILDNL